MSRPCFSVTRFGLARFLLTSWLGVLFVATANGQNDAPDDIKPATSVSWQAEAGDRIVFLGPAFMERMQADEYVETWLTILLRRKNITFRNLGWSGDNAFGHARAVFGAPKDGFDRLKRDLRLAAPTVVFICYGGNEAHRGEAGLVSFRDGMTRILDLVESLSARAVLISPRAYEYQGKRGLDPAPYNLALGAYCRQLQQLAADRQIPYLDLYSFPGGKWTDNGLHLTPYGYWRLASRIARELQVKPAPWEVDIDAESLDYTASGTLISSMEKTESGIRFAVLDESLPFPPPPSVAPRNARRLLDQGVLRIRGLPAGRYAVYTDGKLLLRTDYNLLAIGQQLTSREGEQQSEKLRLAIKDKNQLFFHRYRPQNETYLFLFRKHEQGQNAQEVAQFDTLVSEQEREIARLAKPRSHTYEIRPIDSGT